MVSLLLFGPVWAQTEPNATPAPQAEPAQKSEDQEAYEKSYKAYWEAEPRRWTIVKPSQIELRNISLTPINYIPGFDYNLVAAIKNKSSVLVTGLKLAVTAYDCPANHRGVEECDAIERKEETVILLQQVPAKEIRRLDLNLLVFGPLTPPPPLSGVLYLTARVAAVRGRVDAMPEDGLLEAAIYGKKP